ncbi:putative S-adenosylmethionine-dependent methyltransferase RcsF isoform X2 [Tripterygium wilfordii]|uniref:putative S-adenosylmethionine-dependent methyltransferase RcsF isoform X2 n=1 Tax=Tripterygium wilfordii TaxID=458696 RepID=UPI0018F82094|nr:putative S-adenosylmethionine-dependent methyltransferase RcsF isoform X2 [Tripterygium wilfordii]
MTCNGNPKWLTTALTLVVAAISASTTISLYFWKKKSKDLETKVGELKTALNSSVKKCAAERKGRIRAQQGLRKALTQSKSENLQRTSYPLTPIGIVHSCFSTRNGTPRQPLLVPLAKASLVFDPSRVPVASLEGLEEYSHCWILYVFHLNTDLDKLWNPHFNSKFKAKVRVPRLKGGRMGVFATRSPHRPCPIGLTVAKVEAVQGNKILLSGVDLVDGTPVLDIKPYLPYCDSVQEATVPKWVDNMLTVTSVSFSDGFSSALSDCWQTRENKTLYESPDELLSLIKQVLSWDIRSVSQRNRPHGSLVTGNYEASQNSLDLDDYQDEEASDSETEQARSSCKDLVYHLNLEGLDISYRIDSNGNVVVEDVTISSNIPNGNQNH